jgi:hypothetical protein
MKFGLENCVKTSLKNDIVHRKQYTGNITENEIKD